jgi:hypothetical protein
MPFSDIFGVRSSVEKQLEENQVIKESHVQCKSALRKGSCCTPLMRGAGRCDVRLRILASSLLGSSVTETWVVQSLLTVDDSRSPLDGINDDVAHAWVGLPRPSPAQVSP